MITQTLRHFTCAILCFFLLSNVSLANQGTALFGAAKPYASMANLSYAPEREIKAALARLGYTMSEYRKIDGVEVSYFVATNEALKQQIIAVRGTANIENALVDISLKLRPNSHINIALHEGFALAAEGIYQAVRPVLRRDYTISTTGHSLGGAVAVILAMFLDEDDYTLGPVVTFGQPKVTNIRGALRFQHLDITRFVTPRDFVPLVPPVDIVDIKDPDIYWHLGKEIVLLEGDDFAELGGIKSMMRATRVFDTQPSLENLAHHKMTGYVEQISRKSEAANRVPYSTGANLLQLFGQ